MRYFESPKSWQSGVEQQLNREFVPTKAKHAAVIQICRFDGFENKSTHWFVEWSQCNVRSRTWHYVMDGEVLGRMWYRRLSSRWWSSDDRPYLSDWINSLMESKSCFSWRAPCTLRRDNKQLCSQYSSSTNSLSHQTSIRCSQNKSFVGSNS